MQNKILDTFKTINGKINFKIHHCQRTYEALRYLNIQIDLESVIKIYTKIETQLSDNYSDKVFKLTLDPENLENSLLEARKLESLPNIVNLYLQNTTEPPALARQFKWAERSYWNQLLANLPANYQDVLLCNQDNQAIETARCNLYLYEPARDVMITPPLKSGCLNGVLRRAVLAEGAVDVPQLGYKKVIEENITLTTLDNSPYLYIGNAVRGLMKARFKLN